jgi:hypothetical protein
VCMGALGAGRSTTGQRPCVRSIESHAVDWMDVVTDDMPRTIP